MERVLLLRKKINNFMYTVAGIVLCFMMMFTVMDVILRCFGRPITGTYELVAVAGAIVVGFAIPKTSEDKGHISVDFFVEGRTEAVKKVFFAATRLLGIALFLVLGWYLILKGAHLLRSGDVSMTLHLPYYPFPFALAVCCFIECFVLIVDFLMAVNRGENHE